MRAQRLDVEKRGGYQERWMGLFTFADIVMLQIHYVNSKRKKSILINIYVYEVIFIFVDLT